MRPERNPLDLNNLPEEYGREGEQVFEDSSIIDSEASDTTKCRKKRNGGKDGKDECGKIYECRFCSLKFCKSQALGGHMNRHRQERETETLNRARQLVFSNENLSVQGGPHLGLRDTNLLGGAQPISSGNFHQSGNMGDPSLPFRSVYPTRLFSGASPPPQPPQPPPQPQPSQPYHYGSSSRLVSYPPHYLTHPMNDYLVGHVCTGNSHQHSNLKFGGPVESNYTCIGAPMGQNFVPNDRAVRGTDLQGEGSLNNQQDWGNGYAGTQQQRSDSFPINRFKDGF